MILYIERRTLIRESILQCIVAAFPREIVCAFADIDQYRRSPQAIHEVSVILYGLDRLGENPSGVTQDMAEVRRIHPAAPVVFLSGDDSPNEIVESLKLGARGYIPGSATLDLAIAALDVVRGGGTYLPHACLSRLSAAPADTKEQEKEKEKEKEDQPGAFTPRQMAVLVRLRQGAANRDIAKELQMSESTVKAHVRNIMQKLKATNRTQVVYLTKELFAPDAAA